MKGMMLSPTPDWFRNDSDYTNGDARYDIYETKGIPINQVATNILGLNDKWKAHGADVVKSLLR